MLHQAFLLQVKLSKLTQAALAACMLKSALLLGNVQPPVSTSISGVPHLASSVDVRCMSIDLRILDWPNSFPKLETFPGCLAVMKYTFGQDPDAWCMKASCTSCPARGFTIAEFVLTDDLSGGKRLNHRKSKIHRIYRISLRIFHLRFQTSGRSALKLQLPSRRLSEFWGKLVRPAAAQGW